MTMKYELAEELKDAGFPQLKPEMAGERYEWHGSSDDGEYLRYPTLSELIEACGDRFGELERCCTGEWRASDVEYKEVFTKDTKEEAVARLWLSLNSNK